MKIVNYTITHINENRYIEIQFNQNFKHINFMKIEIDACPQINFEKTESNLLNCINENIYSHSQIDFSFDKETNHITLEINKTSRLFLLVILKLNNSNISNNSSYILPITDSVIKKSDIILPNTNSLNPLGLFNTFFHNSTTTDSKKKQISCGIKNENISAFIIKKNSNLNE